MTKQQRDCILELRDSGYAVIVWTPDELRTADPGAVEDRSIELGWDVIECLQHDDIGTSDEEN